MRRTYLLKVRQYDIMIRGYRLYVYKITTDNVYRIIGKIFCTALEEIKRIDYSLWTQHREDFWIENGYTVSRYYEPKLSED